MFSAIRRTVHSTGPFTGNSDVLSRLIVVPARVDTRVHDADKGRARTTAFQTRDTPGSTLVCERNLACLWTRVVFVFVMHDRPSIVDLVGS